MVIHDDWMIWEIPPWLWKPPYWVVDGWSITRQGCNYCIGGWSWWIRDLPESPESPESMLRYASRFQKGPRFLDGEFPVSKLFVWSRVWLQWTCYFIFSWGSAVMLRFVWTGYCKFQWFIITFSYSIVRAHVPCSKKHITLLVEIEAVYSP